MNNSKEVSLISEERKDKLDVYNLNSASMCWAASYWSFLDSILKFPSHLVKFSLGFADYHFPGDCLCIAVPRFLTPLYFPSDSWALFSRFSRRILF